MWRAINSPGHHRFAYDFSAVGEDGKLFSVSPAKLIIGGTAVESSYGWSKPVYSPVDGTVISVSDGWPDRQTLSLARDVINVSVISVLQSQKVKDDLRVFAGNYVILASEGYYVFLAHLRNGSLKITAEQSVSQGQLLANVGNSGNSVAPHLHLQINDGPNLLDSVIKEFVFTRFERWTGKSWKAVERTPPVKGELMRFSDV